MFWCNYIYLLRNYLSLAYHIYVKDKAKTRYKNGPEMDFHPYQIVFVDLDMKALVTLLRILCCFRY